MAVEALVFGVDKGALQKSGNFMQRHDVVHVPVVLKSDAQRSAVAIENTGDGGGPGDRLQRFRRSLKVFQRGGGQDKGDDQRYGHRQPGRQVRTTHCADTVTVPFRPIP